MDSYQQEGSNILNVVPRDEIKIADKENVKIYEVIDFVIHKKVKDIIHDVNWILKEDVIETFDSVVRDMIIEKRVLNQNVQVLVKKQI